MNPTSNEGAAKLAMVFTPLLDEFARKINEKTIVTSQEVLIELQKISARLDIWERANAGRKSVTKKNADTATQAAGQTCTGTSGITTTTVSTEIAHPGKFSINKLVYFREQWKTDEAFRKRYLEQCLELAPALESDPTISAKTNENQKRTAEATFAWNFIKKNHPAVHDLIDKEFQAARTAFELLNKPPQQISEAHTPPNPSQ